MFLIAFILLQANILPDLLLLSEIIQAVCITRVLIQSSSDRSTVLQICSEHLLSEHLLCVRRRSAKHKATSSEQEPHRK